MQAWVAQYLQRSPRNRPELWTIVLGTFVCVNCHYVSSILILVPMYIVIVLFRKSCLVLYVKVEFGRTLHM